MKNRLEQEVADLLDTDPELLPLMPELLADLETLGGSPETMATLVGEHARPKRQWRVLDLGCGKGALTLAAVRAFHCHGLGVDAFGPFIQLARQSAHAMGLQDRCRFEQGDLRAWLAPEQPFDLLIYSAIGGLLGPPGETMALLRNAVAPGGYIYIDDGYLQNKENTPPGYEYSLPYETMIAAITREGDKLVGQAIQPADSLWVLNKSNNAKIRLRAEALAHRSPQHRGLIETYVRRQQEECDHLENAFVGASWLLQRKI